MQDTIPEQVVTFTVPLTPPSTNHYTKVCMYTGKDGYAHRGRKLTPEAKAFKEAVAIFARGRTVVPQLKSFSTVGSKRLAELRNTRYRVQVRLFLGKNVRLDSDNAFKVAVDALVHAGVIHADHKVEVHAPVPERDWENPRTEFVIERLEP